MCVWGGAQRGHAGVHSPTLGGRRRGRGGERKGRGGPGGWLTVTTNEAMFPSDV